VGALREEVIFLINQSISASATTSDAASTNVATLQPHAMRGVLQGNGCESQPGCTAFQPNTLTDSADGSLTSRKATQPKIPAGRRKKTFNLNTYKAHALRDYVETIRRYGTTDSYSTEPVS
jgi:hypothetical protein